MQKILSSPYLDIMIVKSSYIYFFINPVSVKSNTGINAHTFCTIKSPWYYTIYFFFLLVSTYQWSTWITLFWKKIRFLKNINSLFLIWIMRINVFNFLRQITSTLKFRRFNRPFKIKKLLWQLIKILVVNFCYQCNVFVFSFPLTLKSFLN